MAHKDKGRPSPEALVKIGAGYAELTADKITYDDYYKICQEHGFTPVDTSKEALYLKGDNQSREDGFKYNLYHHPKGRLFQFIIKPMIIAVVNKIHSAFKGKYDADIFVYTDPRLQFIDKFVKDFIDKHVGNDPGGSGVYKKQICLKMIDIMLGLSKEDIYYRARFMLLLNEYRDKDIKYEIMEAEKTNLETWG